MKKHNIKPLVLSALSALAVGAVGTVGTFALFTDKAETKVDIGAGIVDIESNVTIESVASLNSTDTGNEVATNKLSATLCNGGTALVDGGSVTLQKFTPGDQIVLKARFINKSNVKIRSRFNVTHTSTSTPDLFEALDISYEAVDKDAHDISYKLMEWDTYDEALDTEIGYTLSDVTISIKFRDSDNGSINFSSSDNAYQDTNCTIRFVQEAVQGNAYTPTTIDKINEILDESATKNPTMYQALQEANITADYCLSKSYVWDSINDKFVYEATVSNDYYKYFKPYQSISSSPTFSVYANHWNGGTAVELAGIGFDSGDETGFTSLHYINNGSARTVVIRSNDGILTIDAPNDTVNHYNYASLLQINAIGGNSYHEYGSVGQAVLSSGHLVVEKGGSIAVLEATDNTEEKSIEVKGVVLDMTSVDATEVEVTGDGNYGEQVSEDEDASIIKVYNYDQLQQLADDCTQKGITYKGLTIQLENDIDFTGKSWRPFGRYVYRGNWRNGSEENIVLRDTRFFMGNIDGRGHKLKNFSNVGYAAEDYGVNPDTGYYAPEVSPEFGLIRIATGDITIKNLEIIFAYEQNNNQKIKGNGIIGNYFMQEIDPVAKVVYDSVNDQWNTTDSARFNRQTGEYQLKSVEVLFKDIKASGNIVAKDSTAVFIGTTYGNGTHPQTLDDKGIYEWRSAKWAFESATNRNGDNRSVDKEVQTMSHADGEFFIKNYAKTDGSGWFAEPFLQSGNSPEIYFTINGQKLTYVSGNCVGYAPLYVNYRFENCDNTANVTAFAKRAGIYFGKFSNGTHLLNMATMTFVNTVNGGNVSDVAGSAAGVILGYGNQDMISFNLDGLNNTGTATRGETVYEGNDALGITLS